MASNQYQLDYARKKRVERKAKGLQAYGGQCVCCGESNPVFLTIDHINNDGAQHREEMGYKANGRGELRIGSGTTMYWWLEKNGYPDGHQVLCANCNMAKQSLGKCPHQLALWVD